jgi:hypothetical protein
MMRRRWWQRRVADEMPLRLRRFRREEWLDGLSVVPPEGPAGPEFAHRRACAARQAWNRERIAWYAARRPRGGRVP